MLIVIRYYNFDKILRNYEINKVNDMKLLVILFLIKGNLNYKIGLFQKKKRKKKIR